MRASEYVALQLDKSTDLSNETQLLVYIRFISQERFVEEILFCKALERRTTGKDIFFFKVLDDYTKSDGLEWTRCVGGCSDGATAMTVKISGVTALIKQKAPDVVATHCEALVAKMMDNKLNQVLQEVIQVVNFIKALPMTHRLFTMLCKMRWAPILRGCCFTRMCTGCHGAQF